MKTTKLYPLTREDAQLHFIVTSVKYGLCTKQEAKRAIRKLREQKIIEENMYQAHTYI